MHGKVIVAILISVPAIWLAGCGGMTRTAVEGSAGGGATSRWEGRELPVAIGEISANIDQPEEMKAAICRYLRDVAAAEIDRQPAFVLVGGEETSDLLAGYGLQATPAKTKRLAPEHALDLEVMRLEEKLGATVKIGLASTQQKQALAEVKVSLRALKSGQVLNSVKKGKSSKGAWGIIASVSRQAMQEGQAGWQLDGSMIGLACAEAVQQGLEDLEQQLKFRDKILESGVDQRLVQPRNDVIFKQ